MANAQGSKAKTHRWSQKVTDSSNAMDLELGLFTRGRKRSRDR